MTPSSRSRPSPAGLDARMLLSGERSLAAGITTVKDCSQTALGWYPAAHVCRIHSSSGEWSGGTNFPGREVQRPLRPPDQARLLRASPSANPVGNERMMCNAHSRSAIRLAWRCSRWPRSPRCSPRCWWPAGARPGPSIEARPKAVAARPREVAGGSALDHDPALRRPARHASRPGRGAAQPRGHRPRPAGRDQGPAEGRQGAPEAPRPDWRDRSRCSASASSRSTSRASRTPSTMILSSKGFDDMLNRYEYLRRVQSQDTSIAEPGPGPSKPGRGHGRAGSARRVTRSPPSRPSSAHRRRCSRPARPICGREAEGPTGPGTGPGHAAAARGRRQHLQGRSRPSSRRHSRPGAPRRLGGSGAVPGRSSSSGFIWPVNGPITSPFCEPRPGRRAIPGSTSASPPGPRSRRSPTAPSRSPGPRGRYGNYTCIDHGGGCPAATRTRSRSRSPSASTSARAR